MITSTTQSFADTQSTPTILIVDDAPENLTVLGHLLQPFYRVRVATSGQKALRIVLTPPVPDLILLDVMMPEMDGYQVYQKLRESADTMCIPVIFVTAMDSAEAELQGFDAGAVDYITKPIVPPILLARVRIQLELKQSRDCLANQNAWLESEVARRVAEIEVIQEVSIRALARLAETRDSETGNHILRTQKYVKCLALLLQQHSRFCEVLTPEYINLLARSAPLHDIGKVGIPDAILQKPGKLDADEWEIMKTHSLLGAMALEEAENDVQISAPFLGVAKEIAHYHHEKWDGSGYPEGLTGDNIPLSARIMAIADFFDAVISRRVYKRAYSFDEVRQMITDNRDKHFDPDIADTFLDNFNCFVDIAIEYSDA